MAGGGKSYRIHYSNGDKQENHQSRILNNVSGGIHGDWSLHHHGGDDGLLTSFNNGVGLVSAVGEASHHRPPSNQSTLNQQVAGGSSGLRLRRSPSLVQSSLTKEKQQKRPCGEKFKAANFHGVFLQIGSWKWTSINPGDLVAKLYYAKKKVVWEVLYAGLKKKMEISWSAISAINAFINQDENGRLEIELNEPPQFGQELPPEKGKHTQWAATTDFTLDQALIYRWHTIECLPGVINKHFERLMQCDERLFNLSRQPFPISNSPFFHSSCLNFSHNHTAVVCSSIPAANSHQQAFFSHVQNMVPTITPFVPHSSSSLPSSAALYTSISQEMPTSAVGEQRVNLSSIHVGKQDSLLPSGLEPWMLDELLDFNISTDILDFIEHCNDIYGCGIDSTIKAFDENDLSVSKKTHGDMKISNDGNGFTSNEHNSGLAVEDGMHDFSGCKSATNHMACPETQIYSLKEVEFIDGQRALPGPSSWLPSEFNNGDNGVDQMGVSVDKNRSFDPPTGIGELAFNYNLPAGQVADDEVNKNGDQGQYYVLPSEPAENRNGGCKPNRT